MSSMWVPTDRHCEPYHFYNNYVGCIPVRTPDVQFRSANYSTEKQ